MNASLRRSVILCTLAAVGWPSDPRMLGAATASAQTATVPLSRPDSARIHREAQIALRAFLWQLEEKAEVFDAIPLEFSCEDSYFPYCFGPGNGGIRPGGLGTRAVEFRYADANIPAMTRTRFHRLHRHYFGKLEGAHRKLPGDRWIVGQRVFHLVERAQLSEAGVVAAHCRAEQWWCASLVGYVAHLEERYARADSAFAVALRTMPEPERCRWEDLSPLIEGDDADSWYRALPCAERTAVNDTLWWLADPLYLAPGNERRSAHYLRAIYTRLSRDFAEVETPEWRFVPLTTLPGVGLAPAARAPTGEGSLPDGDLFLRPCPRTTWRTDDYDPLGRIVIRNGVPSHLARNRLNCQLLLFTHPLYRFFPTLSAVRDPVHAPVEAWSPHARWSKEYYRPRFGDFTDLDHQLAWFRRNDSARVVAALDVGRNALLNRAETVASALVLSTGPGDSTRVQRTPIRGREHVYTSSASSDSVLVSLEAFAPGVGAARARYGSGPAPMPSQRIRLSDILVLDEARDDLTSLDSAVVHAAPTVRVERDRPLGIYWEVYGVEAGDSLTFSLSTAEGRVVSLRARLGRALGVTAGDSTTVEWTEQRHSSSAVSGQSLTLGLSSLAAGRHLLRLRVRVSGQQPVTVSRWIELVDR